MLRLTLGLILCVGFTASAQSNTWTEKLKLSGDLRFRHDWEKTDEFADRHRERMRIRLGIGAKISDELSAKVRLATAQGGDPISNNQSFDDNANKKSVYFDLAMIEWKATDILNVFLGKQENIFRVVPASQVIYDADYTPEGVSFDAALGGLFFKAGGYVLEERAPVQNGAEGSDAYLLAAMVGFKNDFANGDGFTVAAGFHEFTVLKGYPNLNTGATNSFRNNSNATGNYLNEYKVMELVGEYHMRIGQTGKISLYADGVQNSDPDEMNKGFLAGATLMELNQNDKTDWSIGYNYRTVDRDATVSAVSDSDFANGNVGSKGHTFMATKALNEFATLGATIFVAGVDDNNKSYETKRGLVDLLVNF